MTDMDGKSCGAVFKFAPISVTAEELREAMADLDAKIAEVFSPSTEAWGNAIAKSYASKLQSSTD